ncbi:hypothetical protein Golax_015114, partial [Gossypium laxum]|nr:hypothetical protein [Gossypium laxum]
MCFDLLKSAGQKEFYLHKRCANLPNKIQHPSHSIHPLNLYTSHHPQIGRTISCDECRDICLGFIYLCEQCDLKLDVKCAALRTHKTTVSQEKEMARVTESQHFNHHHKLALGYCNDPIDETKCTICELPIIGPAYFCREYNCDYILHESCLRFPHKIEVPFQWNEIPFQMHQVPFHREHVFVSCVFPHEDSKPPCYACPFALKSLMFAYNCEHCLINLHPTCASSLRRPLKSSFVEDDSRDHRCEFCEEDRNPNDHAYYCEDCNGQVIAHVECVFAGGPCFCEIIVVMTLVITGSIPNWVWIGLYRAQARRLSSWTKLARIIMSARRRVPIFSCEVI